MDKSDEIKARAARYNRVEYVDDAYGRSIGVKILKTSQRIRVEEMAPGITGDIEVKDAEGNTFPIPRIARLIWAASVVAVDGHPIVFPKTRAELDMNLDMLDDAGLSAAAEGVIKLNMGDEGSEPGSAVDKAKN